MRKVEAMLEELGGTRTAKSRPAPDALEAATGTRIGTDESGKGEYFRPRIVVGVVVPPETEANLGLLGVRESTTLSDKRRASMAPRLREVLAPTCFEPFAIAPEEYNRLYDPLQGDGALILVPRRGLVIGRLQSNRGSRAKRPPLSK